MNKLIQSIVNDSVSAAKCNWNRYAELLLEENPTATHIAEMKALMPLLSKRPEDLAEDRKILEQAAGLQERIRRGSNLAQKRADSQKAVAVQVEETRRIIAEREAKFRELRAQQDGFESHYIDGVQATDELRRLVGANANLLAHIPQPSPL